MHVCTYACTHARTHGKRGGNKVVLEVRTVLKGKLLGSKDSTPEKLHFYYEEIDIVKDAAEASGSS